LLDGVHGGATGISVLRDGTMRGMAARTNGAGELGAAKGRELASRRIAPTMPSEGPCRPSYGSPYDGPSQDEADRAPDPIECPNCPKFLGRCRNALKSLVFAVVDSGHRVAVPMAGVPALSLWRGRSGPKGHSF
jgi:hypothetical protein